MAREVLNLTRFLLQCGTGAKSSGPVLCFGASPSRESRKKDALYAGYFVQTVQITIATHICAYKSASSLRENALVDAAVGPERSYISKVGRQSCNGVRHLYTKSRLLTQLAGTSNQIYAKQGLQLQVRYAAPQSCASSLHLFHLSNALGN